MTCAAVLALRQSGNRLRIQSASEADGDVGHGRHFIQVHPDGAHLAQIGRDSAKQARLAVPSRSEQSDHLSARDPADDVVHQSIAAQNLRRLQRPLGRRWCAAREWSRRISLRVRPERLHLATHQTIKQAHGSSADRRFSGASHDPRSDRRSRPSSTRTTKLRVPRRALRVPRDRIDRSVSCLAPINSRGSGPQRSHTITEPLTVTRDRHRCWSQHNVRAGMAVSASSEGPVGSTEPDGDRGPAPQAHAGRAARVRELARRSLVG